jgi:hypothetical protein
MRVIRFDAQRLPFKPLERQVIYFDPAPYKDKLLSLMTSAVDQHYDDIRQLFAMEGLDFCFLPRISRELQIPELLEYFRPDMPPEERNRYLKTVTAENLTHYFAREEDIYNLPIGLIKYTGQQFDNDYIFNYTPIDFRRPEFLLEEIKQYIHYNSQGSPYSWNHPDMSSASTDLSYDVNDMLTQAQMLVQRLREQGVNDMVIEEIFHPTQRLSRLHVRYSRIILPDYQNMEIHMTPLPKAVFLLYLKHPEGIRFCDLPDYRDELLHIYTSFSGRDNMDAIRASINDVTNPLSNSINEKCSRIRQAFLSKFEDRLARNYYITGPRAEAKKILLPRDLVTWEE